jgi:hypothetical protein
MSGTQLNNVAMDLDGFLRTYGACEKNRVDFPYMWADTPT